MGGVFDPVHEGHVVAALAAREVLALDEIWFMVTERPPHKAPVAPLTRRLAMLRLAVGHRSGVKISKEEMGGRAPRYTIESLRHLSRQFPRNEWWYVMGGDAALGFKAWRSWKEFPKWCRLAVVARPGVPVRRVRFALNRMGFREGREYVMLPVRTPAISSTVIRRSGLVDAVEQGRLSRPVASFIRRHRLYRD